MRSRHSPFVLPTQKRERLKFGRNAVIVLLLFGIYCFVNVWQNASITHLVRQNETLRRELTQVNRQCDMLAYKLEQLKDPDRVKSTLRGVTHLVPAETMVIAKGSGRR